MSKLIGFIVRCLFQITRQACRHTLRLKTLVNVREAILILYIKYIYIYVLSFIYMTYVCEIITQRLQFEQEQFTELMRCVKETENLNTMKNICIKKKKKTKWIRNDV